MHLRTIGLHFILTHIHTILLEMTRALAHNRRTFYINTHLRFSSFWFYCRGLGAFY